MTLDSFPGLIWAQQPNGEIFSFSPSLLHPTEVIPPEPGLAFLSLSATEEAVWGVLPQGMVAVRAGMAPHCPHGLKWELQDLQQLGKLRLQCMFSMHFPCVKSMGGNLQCQLVAFSIGHSYRGFFWQLGFAIPKWLCSVGGQ